MLALFGASVWLGLLGPSGPAGAATAAGGPARGTTFSLLAQPSAWVMPGQSFSVDLGIPPGTPAGAGVAVTLYDKLETRSALEQTISGPPAGTVLDRTGPVALSTLSPRAGGVGLSVAVFPESPSGSGPSGAPLLDLRCTPDTGTCSGVYPAVISLARPGGAGTIGRFTTYLTYAEARSAQPLRFAWVVPVAAPVVIGAAAGPGSALGPPTPRQVAAIADLAAELRASPVPVTVEPSPQTVQGLGRVEGPAAAAARGAVADLAALSADQEVHDVPPQPYVPIDANALSGEGAELAGQMAEGAPLLERAGIETTAPGAPATWVAGAVSPGLGTSLEVIGGVVGSPMQVVVPDAALTTPAEASSGITWGYPFTLTLGRGRTFQAAATDGELAAHFDAEPGDPALAANQLLADLAFVHFEQPNLSDPRGVIAVPPPGWTPDASFDRELLNGLRDNPDVEPVTLGGFFSQVPLGGNGAPTSRSLAQGDAPQLPVGLAHQISAARLRLTAFDSAVPKKGTPVLSELDDILLASQSTSLDASGQRAGVATFEGALADQLSLVQLATERTITVTARTAAIPITVLSNAPYTVVGTLTLTSNKFVFPPPGPTRPGVVLDHPTTPLRIEAVARTSGDLPVEASFVSPAGGLLIARGQLTVRSTATSWVGVVLSALALAVLGAWWARTWWGGRRRKRAERAGAE